jgi:iron complex transport system substrate-binding protein
MPKTSRWLRRSIVPLALTVTVLAACGDDDSDSGAAATSTTPAATAFPVTIKHALGEATIESEPKRVVTIGFNEADFALALGVQPVGERNVLGDFDADNRSWARDLMGEAKPEKVGSNELELEKIAALQPDLILGIYSYIDQATYDKLSQIAPTVAATSTKASDPWQQQTLTTGRALGREEQAKKLVAEVEAKFAEVREAHPDFEGKSLAYSLGIQGNGSTYSLEETDLRTQLFTGLGFTLPEKTGELSRERVDLLDEDVLVIAGNTAAQLAKVSVLNNLDVVRGGHMVNTGGFETELNGAIGYSSPLSLPRALELVAPELQDALDGQGS